MGGGNLRRLRPRRISDPTRRAAEQCVDLTGISRLQFDAEIADASRVRIVQCIAVERIRAVDIRAMSLSSISTARA